MRVKSHGLALVLGIASLVATLVLLGLVSTLIDRVNRALDDESLVVRVDNVACPRPDGSDDCAVGVHVGAAHGHRFCQAAFLPPGVSCESQCYAPGTATTCTESRACAAADPTACLGHCAITDVNQPIGHPEHPDCADKLAFKPYFVWDTPTSSDYSFLMLYHSDRPGDCFAEFGCTWSAFVLETVVRTNATSGLAEWYVLDTAMYDCAEFLDMNNSQCIETRTIRLGDNFSNTLFRTIMQPFRPDVNLSVGYAFRGHVCLYRYKCAALNTTYYLNPAYTLPAKRVVADLPRDTSMLAILSEEERAVASAVVRLQTTERDRFAKRVLSAWASPLAVQVMEK